MAERKTKKDKATNADEESGAAQMDDQDEDEHESEVAFRKAPAAAASVLQVLRSRHHKTRLGGARIWLLLSPKDMTHAGQKVDAKVSKASARERCLLEVDGFIILREEVWTNFESDKVSKTDFNRLLDHELHHFEYDGVKAVLTIRPAPHEFAEIIRRYPVDKEHPLTRAYADKLQLDLGLDDAEATKGKGAAPASTSAAAAAPASE